MSDLQHATRSVVFNAVFNLMKKVPASAIPGATVWKTASQNLVTWDECTAIEQPAMFLHRGPQISEQKHVFGVTKQLWKASIWLYFRIDGLKTSSMYPDLVTDQLLDSFEMAFQSDPTIKRLTLGTYINSIGRTEEICYHCWIDGTIFFDSGINDNQGVIVIPLSILI
jgi:hypothetical protein